MHQQQQQQEQHLPVSLMSGQLFGGRRVEELLKDGHCVLHDNVQLLLVRVVEDVIQFYEILVVELTQELNLPLHVRLTVRYLPQALLLHDLRSLPLQGLRVKDFFNLWCKWKVSKEM